MGLVQDQFTLYLDWYVCTLHHLYVQSLILSVGESVYRLWATIYSLVLKGNWIGLKNIDFSLVHTYQQQTDSLDKYRRGGTNVLEFGFQFQELNEYC